MLVSSTIYRASQRFCNQSCLPPGPAPRTRSFFSALAVSGTRRPPASALSHTSHTCTLFFYILLLARPPRFAFPELPIMSANESLPLFHDTTAGEGQDNMVPNTSTFSLVWLSLDSSPTYSCRPVRLPALRGPVWSSRLCYDYQRYAHGGTSLTTSQEKRKSNAFRTMLSFISSPTSTLASTSRLSPSTFSAPGYDIPPPGRRPSAAARPVHTHPDLPSAQFAPLRMTLLCNTL